MVDPHQPIDVRVVLATCVIAFGNLFCKNAAQTRSAVLTRPLGLNNAICSKALPAPVWYLSNVGATTLMLMTYLHSSVTSVAGVAINLPTQVVK